MTDARHSTVPLNVVLPNLKKKIASFVLVSFFQISIVAMTLNPNGIESAIARMPS